MKEFLVEMTTVVPPDVGPAEEADRRAAEAVRARELAAAGHLVRLWKPAGDPRTIGLWRATDETALHDKVIGTLPLRPWMILVVTPLESHPNDPGKTDPAE
ncbi:MAG TPA: muconolactone Delta-isomerase family protein [Trebonia sp.]